MIAWRRRFTVVVASCRRDDRLLSQAVGLRSRAALTHEATAALQLARRSRVRAGVALLCLGRRLCWMLCCAALAGISAIADAVAAASMAAVSSLGAPSIPGAGVVAGAAVAAA